MARQITAIGTHGDARRHPRSRRKAADLAVVAGLGLLMGHGAMTVGAQPARAGDVTLQAKPVAVTVFPRGARVQRTGTTQLPAGQSVVRIAGLPQDVDRRSIRVRASAEGRLLLGPFDLRMETAPANAGNGAPTAQERKTLERQLAALGIRRDLIEREIDRARAQRRMMENLAANPLPLGSAGASSGGGGQRPALDVAALGSLFELIGTRMGEADDAIATAERRRRQIDKKIKRVQERLALVPRTDKRQLVLAVPLRNFEAEAVTAQLEVTYQVQRASWSPLYEGRLKVNGATQTSKGQIAGELLLTRRAQISQSTGEDWSGVQLTLSTSRPSGRTTAPNLQPLLVDFRQPIAPAAPAPTADAMTRRSAQNLSQEFAQSAAPRSRLSGGARRKTPARQTAKQVTATTASQTFQETYLIPGAVDVPANGQSKQVVIGELALSSVLSHRVVPARDPTVYLAAQLELPANVRLLPGQIALFRDGIFIGTGRLPQLAGGATHKLGFGQDDRVKATFDPGEDTRGRSGTFTTSNTQRRTFVVTLTNRHDRDVNVEVQGQTPVSRNEDIEVVALGAALQPTQRDLERKRGVLAWNVTVPAGQEAKLNYGYQLSWPQDKEVIFRNGR